MCSEKCPSIFLHNDDKFTDLNISDNIRDEVLIVSV